MNQDFEGGGTMWKNELLASTKEESRVATSTARRINLPALSPTYAIVHLMIRSQSAGTFR